MAKQRKKRSKGFKIDNQEYLLAYISFIGRGGEFWDDWHKCCIETFGYREEEKDGALFFHNEANEGANLTLASVKSRFTRLQKKFIKALADSDLPQAQGTMLKPLKNRPKEVVPKKPAIDWNVLITHSITQGALTKEAKE